MANPLVLNLEEVSEATLPLVGAKAVHLGRLKRWGYIETDAFVVTTKAYDGFVRSCEIDESIANLLGTVDALDLLELERVSREIYHLFEMTALPLEISSTIQEQYAKLRSDQVAIRSSATLEDLADASFAGQLDSYLNVRGADEVERHIRLCWASLWTPRAILYRGRHDIDDTYVSIAVIIQEMLLPEVSGIMFTADPVTGRGDHLVIDASYGLGEAIVSGAVTPDSFMVHKPSLSIRRRSIGTKELMFIPDQDGGTSASPTPADWRSKSSLSQEQITQLASLGCEIEKRYVVPQDIEWALVGNKIYFLQTRPVTTLTRPIRIRPFVTIHLSLKSLLLDFLLDYFPVPPSQFDRSILLSLIDRTFQLSEIFGLTPPVSSELLKVESDGSMRLHATLPRFRWTTPFKMVRGLLAAWKSLFVDPGIWVESQWPRVSGHLQSLVGRNVRELTDNHLLDIIAESIRLRDKEIFDARQPYILGGWIAMGTLPVVLRLLAGKEASQLHFALMSRLDHPTAQMNRQLRLLARTARSSKDVQDILLGSPPDEALSQLRELDEGRHFVSEFDKFLGQFGNRTGTLMPAPTESTWYDRPSTPLQLIVSMLRSSDSTSDATEDKLELQYVGAVTRVRHLASRFPLNLLGIPPFIERLTRHAQAMVIERDWIIFAYEQVTYPVRMSFREASRRLTERGALSQESDGSFLSISELSELLLNATSIKMDSLQIGLRQRKMSKVRNQLQWGKTNARRALSYEKVGLKGIGASPGVANGTARVILSDRQFSRLSPQELIVCRATNPSWTPLFAIACAVVSDTGGPLSHAAIVAREYGIPAVLGTKIATMTIIDGEEYTVDGTRGEVRGSRFQSL